MNQNYPSLDSSSHKSQEAGYQYVEPPRSSNTTFEQNQAALIQPLIDPKPAPTSNPNSTALSIHAVFIIIEVIIYFIVLKHSYLFEYCFWSFGIQGYFESEYYPFEIPEQGSNSKFLFKLECDKSDFNICPGICEVVERYSDSILYFVCATSIRYVLHCISTVWIVLESKNLNYEKIRKIFAYFHIAAFLVLITGISFILLYPGFQNLDEPLELNEDELNPESFEWKASFYLILFTAVWMPVTSLIAYSKLK